MGGVPGHMSHLYDNQDLTFSEMKEIMDAASNGDLSTEEKVDGQNIVLSYSISEGKAKGARNKGNLKQGGLDASGLAQKFAGRGTLEQAFTSGFSLNMILKLLKYTALVILLLTERVVKNLLYPKVL